LPAPNAIAPPPSPAHFELLTVNFRLFCSKPFSFTHFRKNASANPLDSHTFKTKDLKPFCFIHFQKSGRGVPLFFHWAPFSSLQSRALHASPDSCRDRRFWVLSTLNCGLPTSNNEYQSRRLLYLLILMYLLCLSATDHGSRITNLAALSVKISRPEETR